MNPPKQQLEQCFINTLTNIIKLSKLYYEDNETDISFINYKQKLHNTLHTFLNNIHISQSKAYFNLINNIDNLELPELETNNINISLHTGNGNGHGNGNKITNSKLYNNVENSNSIDNSSSFINSYVNEEDIESLESSNGEEEEEQQTTYLSDSSSCEFISQCCARLGSIKYKVETHNSEFIDNYPPGVYIDMNGYIIGNPCNSTIPDEEFDNGRIYCIEHMMYEGIEDCREKPKLSNVGNIKQNQINKKHIKEHIEEHIEERMIEQEYMIEQDIVKQENMENQKYIAEQESIEEDIATKSIETNEMSNGEILKKIRIDNKEYLSNNDGDLYDIETRKKLNCLA